MSKLIIAPLSTPQTMTRAAWQAIQGADRLFLQTTRHPSAAPVLEAGLTFISMDDLYEQAEDFDALNLSIAQRLTEGAGGVYAVMGGGCGAQLPAIEKACREKGMELKLLGGVSFIQAAFPEAQEGVFVHANGLQERPDTDLPLFIDELDSLLLAGEVKNRLQEFYPDEWPVTLAVQSHDGAYEHMQIPLYALDRQKGYFSSTVVMLPPLPFEKKNRYGYMDALRVLRRLRAPGGCPWDREQTHESLRLALREECYELMDAIREADDVHMVEELGDVLMLVLFHSLLGEETGDYTDLDVTTGLVQKLIYRHPHVFAGGTAKDSQEVLANWDVLKRAEKGQTTYTDTLKSVPRSFPALLRGQKIQAKARKAGFDYADAREAFFKIPEETAELKEAMEKGEQVQKEMGDLFFACINVCRLLGMDCEETAQLAGDKFIRRFEKMEQLARQSGRELETLSLPEQDALWENAKTLEKI